ncbi:MAG: hypothetical protein D6698_04075 [Gammaproteobacteria bacterium]|nr:MAG: hypothetical protein D6698_04075 [Gammaproteobacteria bacterium]
MTARKTLADFRKRVLEKTQAAPTNSFWAPGDLPMNGSARVRFAPYESKITAGFWEEVVNFRFQFFDENDKPVYVTIPSLATFVSREEMRATQQYCPLLSRANELFRDANEAKDSGDTATAEHKLKVARSVWPRRYYLYQGFIVSGSDKNPNELSVIRVTKAPHQSIVQPLLDPELVTFTDMPTGTYTVEDAKALMNDEIPEGMTEEEFVDMFMVREFIFRKTKKGEFNDYSSSMWSTERVPLDDEQIAYIAENGLLDLTQYMPKRPTAEQYELYMDILEEAIAVAEGESDGRFNPEWESPEYGLSIYRATDNATNETAGGASASPKQSVTKPKPKLVKPTKKAVVEEETSDTAEEAVANIRSKIQRRSAKVTKEADEDVPAAPVSARESAARLAAIRKRAAKA